MASPAISIILPVYNCGPYVADTVQSLLDQTFTDFELIIVDDGSTDNSWEEICKFTDPRIIALQNEVNKGKIFSLNRGLDQFRGDYYATMDGDDIALPTRLQKQYDYLESHPEVTMVTSYLEIFGPAVSQRFGEENLLKAPHDPVESHIRLLFTNVHYHNNNLIRGSWIRENNIRYRPQDTWIEDYEIWVRLTRLGGIIHTIPEPLVKYRIHGDQMCLANGREMRAETKRIVLEQLGYLGLTPNEGEYACHMAIGVLKVFRMPGARWSDVQRWAEKLKAANRTKQIYPQQRFDQFIDSQLQKLAPDYLAYEESLTLRDKFNHFRKKIFR